MKKVLLVGGKSGDSADQQSQQQFQAYLEQLLGPDVQYYVAYFDDLSYIIGPGLFQVHDARNQLDLINIDVVYISGMRMRLPNTDAYYLSRYCKEHDIPCIADYTRYYPAGKVAQAILFFEQGLSFLKTLYSVDGTRLITEAEDVFGYPYILKSANGMRGDDNYLIHTRKDAEEALAVDPTVDFLAQEFCPNDYDYRLLIMGKDYLLFERRGGMDSHLNNTSKGGQATAVTDALPEQIIQQSQELAKSLGLMVAGIDIMPHRETGELYFLEVNLQPQIRSGVFLEEKKELMRKMFETLY